MLALTASLCHCMPDPDPPSRLRPEEVPGVHPVYVRLLAQLLERRGISSRKDLERTGLTEAALAGNANLPFARVRPLIEAAVRRSGCTWLGLEFGATIQPHMHGIVGAAALASGTLGAALATIARYAALRFSATRMQLRRGPSHTELVLVPSADVKEARRFIDDALLAIIDHFIRLLAGGRPASLQYRLPAACADAAPHYASILGSQVGYDSKAVAGLRLANVDIDRPCLGADAQAHALATGALERELAQVTAPGALQPQILALLGDASANWPTAHAVARRLHLSPRTLHRRLEAESTSFRALLDACRRARARELLQDSKLSVERIGEILGYADPSNFGRSCRRWFGCSPRQFRQEQASKP